MTEPWPFSVYSAAELIAHCAWPNDNLISEWAPRLLNDLDLTSDADRARMRLESAIAAVEEHRRTQ